MNIPFTCLNKISNYSLRIQCCNKPQLLSFFLWSGLWSNLVFCKCNFVSQQTDKTCAEVLWKQPIRQFWEKNCQFWGQWKVWVWFISEWLAVTLVNTRSGTFADSTDSYQLIFVMEWAIDALTTGLHSHWSEACQSHQQLGLYIVQEIH